MYNTLESNKRVTHFTHFPFHFPVDKHIQNPVKWEQYKQQGRWPRLTACKTTARKPCIAYTTNRENIKRCNIPWRHNSTKFNKKNVLSFSADSRIAQDPFSEQLSWMHSRKNSSQILQNPLRGSTLHKHTRTWPPQQPIPTPTPHNIQLPASEEATRIQKQPNPSTARRPFTGLPNIHSQQLSSP